MQFSSGITKQAAIGGILNKRVLEDVTRSRGGLAGDHQPSFDQRIQSILERSSVQITSAPQELDRELATDRCCGLNHLLSGEEPIEPGHK